VLAGGIATQKWLGIKTAHNTVLSWVACRAGMLVSDHAASCQKLQQLLACRPLAGVGEGCCMSERQEQEDCASLWKKDKQLSARLMSCSAGQTAYAGCCSTWGLSVSSQSSLA